MKRRYEEDVMRKTFLRWILIEFYVFKFSTGVKVAEYLISFTDLLVNFDFILCYRTDIEQTSLFFNVSFNISPYSLGKFLNLDFI